MTSDWQDYTVKEIASPGANALSTGPFGSSISSKFFQDFGVPVIRGSNLSQDVSVRLIDDDIVFVSEDKAKEFTRSIVKTGDLVFTCWGTINQVGLIDHRSKYSRYVISNKQMKLTPDSTKADSLFLYYLFSGPEKQHEILISGIGSSVPGFNLGQLKSHVLHLPPLSKQKTIAKALGDLDDKIALNRQINKTLEQIVQAIFKSWFVDLDPVKAKIEAKENGQDPERAAMCAISGKTDEQLNAWLASATRDQIRELAHIAVLFPDGLIDSELGPIPNGWSVSELGHISDVVDCLHAKKPEKIEENTGNVFLQLNNISDDGLLLLDEVFYISDEDYKKWVSRMEAREGDCVITNVGRVGAVAQIPGSVKAALGRNMTGIRCKPDSYYPTFLVALLTSPFIKSEIERRTDVGTILNALNVRNIPRLRFIHPGPKLLQTFEKRVFPLQRKRELNVEESRFLSNIRDTLLPKLLSGELSLEGVESAAEAVA